jgi:coenzyme F420-reducing hydrogenase gamma subunit
MPRPDRPRLAVFKFSSCDGCQLSLLNLEDQLLELAQEVDVAYFLEARSAVSAGPYDVALVEGSITCPAEAERIKAVRRDSRYLVSIGACATAGGIQALRNWQDSAEFIRLVYATPQYIETLKDSTPISQHVTVDFELNGCPIDKGQLLEVFTSLLIGRTPRLPAYSVCMECKRRGVVCVAVSQGLACLGPLTHAGCGALCPAYGRGCYGCFGPMEAASPDALAAYLLSHGCDRNEVVRLLRGISGYAEAFRAASEKLEKAAP